MSRTSPSPLSFAMIMRSLSSTKDRAAVARLFDRAADYATLENGHPPDRATIEGFFENRPANVGSDDALHLGLFDADHMQGVLVLIFDYPDSNDSYIGLLLMAPSARGLGSGAHALAHATRLARARGSIRQLVAVLDDNPKGRVIWEREGFALEKTFPPTKDGHIRHRMTRPI